MDEQDLGPLDAALARAHAAASRLAPATDELTETLGQIERALVALQLGVSAMVDLPSSDASEDDADPSWDTYLSFGKEGKHWRLQILSGREDDSNSWSVVPLVNASRENRLQAVAVLPKLIEKLAARAEEAVQVVESRRRAAQAVLAHLSSFSKPSGAR